MNSLEILGYINVMAIWAQICVFTAVIAKMKFSLYRCFARKIFQHDDSCLEWLKEHKFYIFAHIQVLLLMVLSFYLLSQINTGLIHLRTTAGIVISICVWLNFCPIINLLYKRAYPKDK